MKVLSYVVFGLVCVIFVLVMVILHFKTKANLLACKLETVEKEKDAYAAQVARLMNASQVSADNRRKADAEVDALHDGDVLDNALNELRKHKG